MLVSGKITKIIKKYKTENLIKEKKKSNPIRDKMKGAESSQKRAESGFRCTHASK